MWDFFLGLAILAFAWIFTSSRREKERTASSATTSSNSVSLVQPSQNSAGSKEARHDPESVRVIEDLKQSLVENFNTIKLLEIELADRDMTIRDYETGRALQSQVIDELREEITALTETMEMFRFKPQIDFFAVSHPPRSVGVLLDEPASEQLLFDKEEPAQKTISRGQSTVGLMVPEYRDEPRPEREADTVKIERFPREDPQLIEQYKQKIDRQEQAVYELSESLTENLRTVKKLKADLEEKNESIRQLQENIESQMLTIEELKASSAKYVEEIEQVCVAKESADIKYENNVKVVSELNTKLKEKEKTVEDLEKGRQEMEHMIETLRDSLSEESQRNQFLHHEIMKLSTSKEKLEPSCKKEQAGTNNEDEQTELINPEVVCLEGELEQKINIIHILEEEKGKCLQQITDLKQNLVKTTNELREASYELREQSAFIADLEKIIGKLEKDKQELTAAASQSSRTMEELMEKLRLESATVKDLQQKNSEQETELKNLNEKLTSSLKEIERYKEEGNNFNLELKHADSVKQKHEETSERLQAMVNEQTLIIDELRPHILELQRKHEEELAGKQDVIQKLTAELESSVERSINLEAETKDNLQVIQELQLEREHQIRINEELKEELTQQASIVQGLQDDLARITQDSLSSVHGNISINDFRKVMKKISRAENDDTIYTLDDVEKEFSIKDEFIKRLTEEKGNSLLKIQELEDKLRSQENTTTSQELENKLKVCQVTVNEQENKLKNNNILISELTDQVSALQQLQDLLRTKEDTIQKLEAKLYLHTDKLKIEERKVKDLEKEFLAQEFVMKEANAEKAKLAKVVEDLQRAVRNAEDRVVSLTEKLEQMRTENEKLRANSRDLSVTQTELQTISREQSTWLEDLQRAVQDGEARIVSLTEELELTRTENEKLRTNNEVSSAVQTKAETTLREQSARLEELRREVQDGESRIVSLTEELELMRTENEKLRANSEGSSATQTELETISREQSARLEELRRAVQDGESRIVRLTEELELTRTENKKLRANNEVSSAAYTTAETVLREQSALLEELQGAVRDGEARIVRLTEELELTRTENEKLRANSEDSSTTPTEVETVLREQNAQLDKLMMECETKTDTIVRLERKLTALEDQLSDAESARNTVQLLEDQVTRKQDKIQQLQKSEEMRVKMIASLESENQLLCEKINDLRKELAQLEQRPHKVSVSEQPPGTQPLDGNGYLVSTADEKVLGGNERLEDKVAELNNSVNSRIYMVRVDPQLDEAEQTTARVASPTLTNGTQARLLESSVDPVETPVNKPPALEESLLDPEFDKYSKYPVAMLKRRSELLPSDVNILRKEVHLSREQFVDTFGIKWEEFAKLPAWKQQNLKKKVGLF